MIILGVDPSFVSAGYALITKEGGRIHLLACDALGMKSSQSIAQRLLVFHDFFQTIICDYAVQHIALETPFLGKNAQNFLKLGYLRGVLLLLAQRAGVGVSEYSPRQAKAAITGFGGASKEQVARVLARFFPHLAQKKSFDHTDALAIALCCVWQSSASGCQPHKNVR